jgi:hypothetical protein
MLTLSENALTDSPVFVLAVDDEPAGFYRLTGVPPEGELADLWLDPQSIGRGLGRQLFEHARDTAAELGFGSLLIESDPNAEGFYHAMGAARVGERRSDARRQLPLLRISLHKPLPNLRPTPTADIPGAPARRRQAHDDVEWWNSGRHQEHRGTHST